MGATNNFYIFNNGDQVSFFFIDVNDFCILPQNVVMAGPLQNSLRDV